MIATPFWADWPPRLLALAGFALALYGGEALLEWHTGATVLPDLPFLPYRVHYDTSWAFLLCGLALFGVIGGAAWAVAIGASAAMLIGALRWIAEVFPALDVRGHPLLGILVPRLQFDDISPPSAFGLVLAAAGIVTLKRPPYSAVRSVIAAMLALSLATLATFLLLGSQSSGPFLYGWLQLDSNDGADALGFLILAAAAAFFVFFGHGPEATAARKWAALAV